MLGHGAGAAGVEIIGSVGGIHVGRLLGVEVLLSRTAATVLIYHFFH